MRKTKYTKELIEVAVNECSSWAQLIRYFGLKVTGGNHNAFQQRCEKYKIDTSHFKGQGWSKGETVLTNETVARVTKKISYPIDIALNVNSPIVHGSRLRELLIKIGREYKCEICGINEWLGNKLTLHVDHENGIKNDNRRENLRFLCPNCHQQTDTWGTKNIKRSE